MTHIQFSTNQDDLRGNQSETSINLIFLEKLNHNLFRTWRTWNSKSHKFHNRQWRHLCHDKNRKWTFEESSSKSIGHCRIVAKGWTSAAAPNKDFKSLEIVAKRTEICSILSQTSSQVKYSFGLKLNRVRMLLTSHQKNRLQHLSPKSSSCNFNIGQGKVFCLRLR